MSTKEAFYTGAYWGDRREDLEACTKRLNSCLSQLHDCDDIFQQWFELGYSRKQALTKTVPIETTALRKLLDKGRHRTDVGSHIIDSLGFRVSLWNGLPEDNGETSISINCGLYADNPGLLNSCVINLPKGGMAEERILNLKVLEKIIFAVARTWEPDWAIVTSGRLRNMFEVKSRSPYFSWLLFLSRKRGVVPTLPVPSKTVQVEGLGTIIVITEERFDAASKNHLKLIKRVYGILQEAGLLARIL